MQRLRCWFTYQEGDNRGDKCCGNDNDKKSPVSQRDTIYTQYYDDWIGKNTEPSVEDTNSKDRCLLAIDTSSIGEDIVSINIIVLLSTTAFSVVNKRNTQKL